MTPIITETGTRRLDLAFDPWFTLLGNYSKQPKRTRAIRRKWNAFNAIIVYMDDSSQLPLAC